MILSDEVTKIKPGVCQASIVMNTASSIEANNNVQGATNSKNNGLQLSKDLDRSVLKTNPIFQSNYNNVLRLQKHELGNMQIPTTTNTFKQQLKDYYILEYLIPRKEHLTRPTESLINLQQSRQTLATTTKESTMSLRK